MSDLAAQAVLELALRVGESMLAVGASAADVTATVLRVAAAYGLTSCQVDVTFSSLAVSYERDDAVPLTGIRIVRDRGLDYTRLQGITDLARAVSAGGVDVEEAHRRLDDVVNAPHPYRRVVGALAFACMAASVGFLLGGGWRVALAAALTTALIDQLRRSLNRRGLPYFFQQVAGAAVATSVAVLLVAWDVGVRSSAVVAAGIVVLLAGLSLVGAAEDAISGFPVTAAARAFEVLTLTAGIVVGVTGVLDLAQSAHLPLALSESAPPAVPPVVQVAAAGGVGGFWALASHARPRAALVGAIAGGLAWTTYSLARELGAGPAAASAGAAVVIGFCGDALTQRLRIPPLLVAVCGIVPLLPGLAIYGGLFAIVVDGDAERGLSSLVGAAAIGLGLAAGVTLGEYFATRIRDRDRFERGVRRRATTRE
jgi:uncharacterized membrane protein YjjP (DUF1212 family)